MQDMLSAEFTDRRRCGQYDEGLTTESSEPTNDGPLRLIDIAARAEHPVAGRSFLADLSELEKHSHTRGVEVGRRPLAALGGRPFESCRKVNIIGPAGEFENGNATHTATMMDLLGGGRARVPSLGNCGEPRHCRRCTFRAQGRAVRLLARRHDQGHVSSWTESQRNLGHLHRRDPQQATCSIWRVAGQGDQYPRRQAIKPTCQHAT